MNNPLLRIVDANANRAREALRTIEDYARFVLDDADAASAAKRLRHELCAALDELGAAGLLAARDVDGDVGRDSKEARELSRSTAQDVLRAAFGRLGESLRSLSEYAKAARAGGLAASSESLRYAAYALEQRLVARGELRRRMRDVRLYVIVTEEHCRLPWDEAAAAALRGGASCLQLREKRMADGELLRRAARLRQMTRECGALLVINDRPDIAALVCADGVHVGQDDLPISAVRRVVGGDVLVGVSTHTRAQFEAALADGPDYVAVGPMAATATKPQDHVAGVALLREVAGLTRLPIVAIGGIRAETAGEIRAAGASAVCVCSAVMGSADPAATSVRILEGIRR